MAAPGRLVGLVLITVPVLIVAGVQAPPPQPSRTGLIVGQIVDASTGRPIGGARVSLGGPSSPPQSSSAPPAPSARPLILTGTDGRFLFRDLPAGNFSISAVKPGHSDGAYGRRRPDGPNQQLRLGDGERIGDVILRLWKFGAITGTVIDEAGEPLVGVQIRAMRRVFVAGRRRFVGNLTATTDDRGVYRFGNLVAGDYMVAAAVAHAALPAELMEAVRKGGAPGALTGGPGGSAVQVGGSVYILDRGAPVPPPVSGDRLFVYPTTFYPSTTMAAQAATISVGSGMERSAIDLQLRPSATVRVSGTVIGPDGPASRLTMRLVPHFIDEVAIEQDVPTALVDDSGGFTFPAVVAGQYSLRANRLMVVGTQLRMVGDQLQVEDQRKLKSIAQTAWAAVPLVVGRIDVEGVGVVLQSGLRVSGRLEFDGTTERPSPAQLEGLAVSIEAADGTSNPVQSMPARVDTRGQFTSIAGFPAGKYFVRLPGSPVGWMFKSATYDGRDVSDTPLDLRSGDVTGVVINFTDRWTGLRGAVQTTSGVPDGGATVVAFPTDPQAWTGYGSTPRRLRSVRTAASGDYKFNSLPAGDYYVVALSEEQAADWQDPSFLQMLTAIATHVPLSDGEQKVQDLRTKEVR